MMAGPVNHDASVGDVLALHASLEPPEGCTAEVIEGIVALSTTPSGRHGLILDELHTQLEQLLPSGLCITNTVTLEMTATRERYVPDLLVMTKEALRTDEWLFDPAEVELVAEISHRTTPAMVGW